ncbi:MAG: peptidoglycan DD-metalloendopeptidase family protein [Candidatus Saganbacteria bacterium]|nr:peptidoglycan DD-metalloendopeptidase family protein [Candidatus Saganbacteria bacterium]
MRSLKILLFLCVLLFIFTGSALCAAADPKDELKDKQKELNRIYQELLINKRKLESTKEKERDVVERLVIINRELKKTKGQLGRAQYQIQKNESRLGYLKVSLEEAKRKLDERNGYLKNRIREIYKNGGINYLDMLVSSDTLADFINRTYFFEKVIGRDAGIVNEITTEHTKIKTDKTELEGVTADIKKLAQYIGNKKQNIEKQAEEKKELHKELEQQRIEYEKKVAVLEETSNQIEQLIRKMIAERAIRGGVSPHGTGNFIWPVRGRITSPFGYRRSPFWRMSHMHTGLDIATSYGTPIQAADGGEVIFSGWWDGYGKAVIIDHGKGISTVYAHMSRIYIQKGQTVMKGQVVGLIGSTGYSTGPHLHFEVRKNGTPTNPIRWLP